MSNYFKMMICMAIFILATAVSNSASAQKTNDLSREDLLILKNKKEAYKNAMTPADSVESIELLKFNFNILKEDILKDDITFFENAIKYVTSKEELQFLETYTSWISPCRKVLKKVLKRDIPVAFKMETAPFLLVTKNEN